MPDGTVSLTPEIKHAGEAGFEWLGGYNDSFNGITLVRFGGLIFCYGSAGYVGDFPGGDICALPEDWRDPIGVDKDALGKGGEHLTLYVSDIGLSVNKAPALPDDGYINVATFWVAP